MTTWTKKTCPWAHLYTRLPMASLSLSEEESSVNILSYHKTEHTDKHTFLTSGHRSLGCKIVQPPLPFFSMVVVWQSSFSAAVFLWVTWMCTTAQKHALQAWAQTATNKGSTINRVFIVLAMWTHQRWSEWSRITDFPHIVQPYNKHFSTCVEYSLWMKTQCEQFVVLPGKKVWRTVTKILLKIIY